MADDVEEDFSALPELLLKRPRIFFFIALRIRPFATRSPFMLAASRSSRGQDSIGMRRGNLPSLTSILWFFHEFRQLTAYS